MNRTLRSAASGCSTADLYRDDRKTLANPDGAEEAGGPVRARGLEVPG